MAPKDGETESALEREDADHKGRRLDKDRMELDAQVLAYGIDEPVATDAGQSSSSAARASTAATADDTRATSSSSTRRSGMNRRGRSKKEREEPNKDTKSDPTAKPKVRGRPKKAVDSDEQAMVPMPEKCAECTNFTMKGTSAHVKRKTCVDCGYVVREQIARPTGNPETCNHEDFDH